MENTYTHSKVAPEFINKQMKLLGFHPGEGLLAVRKLALLEVATCQNGGESQVESRSLSGGWEEAAEVGAASVKALSASGLSTSAECPPPSTA